MRTRQLSGPHSACGSLECAYEHVGRKPHSSVSPPPLLPHIHTHPMAGQAPTASMDRPSSACGSSPVAYMSSTDDSSRCSASCVGRGSSLHTTTTTTTTPHHQRQRQPGAPAAGLHAPMRAGCGVLPHSHSRER